MAGAGAGLTGGCVAGTVTIHEGVAGASGCVRIQVCEIPARENPGTRQVVCVDKLVHVF